MKQFFVDQTGALSMMRLVQFIVIMVVLVVFLGVNATGMLMAIKHGTPLVFTDFPPQSIWAMATVIAGKTIQAFTEKPSTESASTVPPAQS